jgi:hypothetical protein
MSGDKPNLSKVGNMTKGLYAGVEAGFQRDGCIGNGYDNERATAWI